MEYNMQPINADYIRGLVEGEGCFTFCKTDGKYIPTFCIGMHIRDRHLLIKVADYLKIHDEVYHYNPRQQKDGYKRGGSTRLMVRDAVSLKNIIVPFFYKKLIGHKGFQFKDWIERIGADPLVPERYRLIYRLYKNGFWDKPENYLYKWE